MPAPIASVLKHFREEVESHILQRSCPAGVCPCGARAGDELRRASRQRDRCVHERRASWSNSRSTEGKSPCQRAPPFSTPRACNDIAIPTLCHQQNEKPVGVCRVCVVDVGARVFTASCIRPVEPGMVVNTAADGVKRARHTLVELLMSDHPSPVRARTAIRRLRTRSRSPSRKTSPQRAMLRAPRAAARTIPR